MLRPFVLKMSLSTLSFIVGFSCQALSSDVWSSLTAHNKSEALTG